MALLPVGSLPPSATFFVTSARRKMILEYSHCRRLLLSSRRCFSHFLNELLTIDFRDRHGDFFLSAPTTNVLLLRYPETLWSRRSSYLSISCCFFSSNQVFLSPPPGLFHISSSCLLIFSLSVIRLPVCTLWSLPPPMLDSPCRSNGRIWITIPKLSSDYLLLKVSHFLTFLMLVLCNYGLELHLKFFSRLLLVL